MTVTRSASIGAVVAVVLVFAVGCAEPERPVRSMEITGRVIAPPGLRGPVEVRLYHAWSLQGELRHPLQWKEQFRALLKITLLARGWLKKVVTV